MQCHMMHYLHWKPMGKLQIRTQWPRSEQTLSQVNKHFYSPLVYRDLTLQLQCICNKLRCATGYWLPRSLFNFFLKFLDQRCWRFSEGYLNNFSTELSSQIFDCCPRNFLIQEERIGNVVSPSHWIRPVLKICIYVHLSAERLQDGKSNFFYCLENQIFERLDRRLGEIITVSKHKT